MCRTLKAGLVLALALTGLGGAVLAQEEPEPSLEPVEPRVTAEPAADATDEAALAQDAVPSTEGGRESTLAFVEPAWHRITPDKGPPSREDHTWTVDGEGRYAYLFGGRDGAREFGDLWRYDLRRDRWKRLSVKGRKPSPRFGHSAVWIDGHGVIVFAGQRGTGFFNDLWVFDPQKGKWRQLPAGGSTPRPRYGSCLVVGPDGRLWMSHGFTTAGRFDDTRAYDLRSERWATISPAGRKPGERCLHECFTSAAGDLVIYGGQDDGAFALGDLWSMGREREWQRLADPGLKPRRLYGVTEAGDHAYVFGGAGEDGQPLADLWHVDRTTLTFERVTVDGKHPAARFAGTLITDAERGRLLLFGGQGSRARSDVWELVDGAAAPDEPVAEPAMPGTGSDDLRSPAGEAEPSGA